MRLFLKFFILLSLGVGSLFAEFLDAQREQAIRENKLILLNIGRQSCPYCQKMEREFFKNAAYRKQVNEKFVLLFVDANDPTLPKRFRVDGVPTNAILAPKNLKILEARTGYIEPTRFMGILKDTYTKFMASQPK